jgi:V/A-type H+-transporting ATPase subunit E
MTLYKKPRYMYTCQTNRGNSTLTERTQNNIITFKQKHGVFDMEELQSLLEKINRDGVEKAEAEAAKIISDAKMKAESIVKNAQAAADKTRSDAEKDAAAFAERASEAVRHAARDTMISIRETLTAMLEKLLAKNVNTALADNQTAVTLVTKAIEGLCGETEIAVAPELAESLKTQLAANSELKITADESIESGFSVKIDGGRIEHSFTDEVIAAELAKRLRPDLAALIK